MIKIYAMKYNNILPVILVIFFAVSTLLGCKNRNSDNSGSSRSSIFGLKAKTITELKNELKLMEIDSIKNLLEMHGTVDSLDKGWFFNHNYVPQLILVLKNKACVARMKDVTVVVDFISKTQTKIGEKQFTIYEFIEPNTSFTFKEKIEIPEQTVKVNFRLLMVGGE